MSIPFSIVSLPFRSFGFIWSFFHDRFKFKFIITFVFTNFLKKGNVPRSFIKCSLYVHGISCGSSPFHNDESFRTKQPCAFIQLPLFANYYISHFNVCFFNSSLLILVFLLIVFLVDLFPGFNISFNELVFVYNVCSCEFR